MLKQAVILGVIVGALIIGGVLEVRVRPSEISHVPARVSAFVRNPELLATVRTTAVRAKRWVEQAITRSETEKLELALLYIKEDIGRLRTLQEEEDTAPATIAAQTKQLTRSLAAAEGSLRSVPVETVLKMQERSQASVTSIREALQQLQKERDARASAQEEFSATVTALQEKLEAFRAVAGSGSQSSSVAGTKDEASPPTATISPSAIPLRF